MCDFFWFTFFVKNPIVVAVTAVQAEPLRIDILAKRGGHGKLQECAHICLLTSFNIGNFVPASFYVDGKVMDELDMVKTAIASRLVSFLTFFQYCRIMRRQLRV